jgi:hypothetical protein
MAWAALPGAYAPASIALWITAALRLSLHDKAVVLEGREGSVLYVILPKLCTYFCLMSASQHDHSNYIWQRLYKYYVSGHYPPSCFYSKARRFGDWILSPSSGETYSVGPQSIELVPISGHLLEHKIGYTSQAQHNPSARAKTKH